MRATTALILLVFPATVSAQIRVHPSVVTVSGQNATTAFISYGGLRDDQRPAEAEWCGALIPATPGIGMRCDPALFWGLLPARYERASPTGNGGYTDVMSVPQSVARRAYQAARRGSTSPFFYVRRVVSEIGLPDEFVVVTLRLIGGIGGAAAPLSLHDVRLDFGNDLPVLFTAPGTVPPPVRATIAYAGSGRLVGRWEVVRPGDELPSETDRLTEATLPIEQRGTQRRYTELSRFNVFLPPSGQITLPGPDPSTIPTDVEGSYLLLLRIEASADVAGGSSLDVVGSGKGEVETGAVAGFALPTLRYIVGASDVPVLPEHSGARVPLLLPRDRAPLRDGVIEFAWMDLPHAALFRLEVERDDGIVVLSAVISGGMGVYRAPPFLAERAEGRSLRWRVVALDREGRERARSSWRTLVAGDGSER